MRVWRRLVVAAVLALPDGSAAQRGQPAMSVLLPPPDSLHLLGPSVGASYVLNDGPIRELLNHGFPARLRFRVELWSTAGWFDDRLGVVEWDVVTRFDPLRQRYDVVLVRGAVDTPLGSFGPFGDMVAEVERPRRAGIVARRGRGEQYYSAVLSLDMLSVTDLDELQRWLSGDLSPAVRGERSPGTALSRGARVLLARLLGGQHRRLEARSRRFRPVG